MSFDIAKFCSEPSVKSLEEGLKKDDWLELGKRYEIEVRRHWRKAAIRNSVIQCLVHLKVLPESALSLCVEEDNANSIKKLELEVRLKEIEREREREDKQSVEREKERKFQLELLEKKAPIQ